MTNYEIMKCQMQKKFLKYNQEEMIQRFHLQYDRDYIYMNFLSHKYRINRINGKVTWSDNDFINSAEADYNEAMTLYDVLCNSKTDCYECGEFVNMYSLSSIKGGSASVGNGLFQDAEKFFDHKDALLIQACERLNGMKAGKGDIAYLIPVFDFLKVIFQFWNSDEDFGASLQLLWDKNILNYMHYETVWFAASHLLTRLKEEMREQHGQNRGY